MTFNQLSQGTSLLNMRSMKRHRLIPQMNILDGIGDPITGFNGSTNECNPRYAYCPPGRDHVKLREYFQGQQGQNLSSPDWAYNQSCPGAGQRSWCHAGPNLNIPLAPPAPGNCPNYSYCPGTGDKLLWEKDDDLAKREAQMDKFNQLLSQYGSLYKNYMENVSQYIKNPPTGLISQNVVVSPLTGAAAPFPSLGTLASTKKGGGKGGNGNDDNNGGLDNMPRVRQIMRPNRPMQTLIDVPFF